MENLAPCVLLVLLSLTCNVQCRPEGAPQGACATLLPEGHTYANNSDYLPGGFFIYSKLFNDGNNGTYVGNTTHKVTLATVDYQFRGFLIQAVDATSGYPIGYFTILDSDNSQLLNCSADSPNATVTHTNNNLKAYISFYWQAPSTDGVVDFRYTVVTAFREDYYGNISAAMNRPPCRVPPPIASSMYTFRIGEANDDYYLRIRANPVYSSYVDVTLEGEAAGWVAVGFSEDRSMDNADVLGCRVDPDGNVTVVDTWNTAPGSRGNELDDTQTDICSHSANFSDGRITCTFSRLVDASDPGQDYDLDGDYWLFYGRRLEAQTTGDSLLKHTNTPLISDQLYNVLQDGGDINKTAANVPDGQCSFNPGTGSDYIFENGTQGTGNYYVATRVNPYNESYLDIYLEGVANGWVAVGLSEDRSMDNADVLGCRVDPDGNVTVVDTWNTAPGSRGNELDDTQTDICYHSTSFTDGRITCRFSRLIAVTDSGQDFKLDGDYWLFYGRRTEPQTGGNNLAMHTNTPTISDQLQNIARAAMPPDTGKAQQCTFDAGTGSDYIYEFGDQGTSDYYIATRVNPNNDNYLDIYLEGTANGWVALGLSEDKVMDNADVLGCRVDGSDVTVVDTWNTSPTRGNELDATQTDICYHSTSFTNGRITCRFSRLIAATDSGQDYDLNGNYYLFYGRRTEAQTSGDNLARHTSTPPISDQLYSIGRHPQAQECTFNAGTSDEYFFSYNSEADDYFVRTRENPNNDRYVEIYLEGVASGWVALGLSEDTAMQSADVVGCRVDPDGNVAVVDTWNIDSGRGNQLDATQTDICYHSKSFTDGTITCSFSRLKQGSDSGQDFDLDDTSYYLFYGRRTEAQTSGDNLAQHTDTPPVSANTERISSGAATLTASILIFILSGLVALHLM